MIELPEEWKSVLNAVIEAPVAWQSPDDVALALGREVGATTDLLSTLDVEGWITVWVREEGPVVTLTALAAERLEVVLVEVGVDETPRWSHLGDPVPSPPRAKHVCRTERFVSQAGVPDPNPSPELSAERAERAERAADEVASSSGKDRRAVLTWAQIEELPRPSLFLGQGLTPWPGPGPAACASCCPSCGDRPLLAHMYCIHCDRWGMDAWLEPFSTKASPAAPKKTVPLPKSSPSVEPVLDRDRERKRLEQQIQGERQRRKAKKKSKRAARAGCKRG